MERDNVCMELGGLLVNTGHAADHPVNVSFPFFFFFSSSVVCIFCEPIPKSLLDVS